MAMSQDQLVTQKPVSTTEILIQKELEPEKRMCPLLRQSHAGHGLIPCSIGLSVNEVGSDILLEFLEVAFHSVLYIRSLYPKEIFVRKKVYGIAVQISEHPDLNAYIRESLCAIRELIKEDEGSVKKIILCYFDDDKKPIEKFVFDFLKLKASLAVKDPYFLKTEEALRTFCLKLSTSDSYLKPLPENSTFSIQIHTHEAAHVALSENAKCENFPWIEAEQEMVQMKEQNLLPLKTVETEFLGLQMYAIESDKKA